MSCGPRARRTFVGLALLAVALGVYGRIAHLDRQLFWQDEAFTTLLVSGHDLADWQNQFDGLIHPVSQVDSFMERKPGSTFAGVVQSIARQDPDQGLLFYAADRVALDLLPPTADTYRLPSVIAGIAAIGFAFALGTTLYGSRTSGAVLAALVALSPLNLLYSRQARPYGVFSCAILASTFFFVRALERKTPIDWIAYGFSVALGLYCDSLFALVIAAHAVSAITLNRRALRDLIPYAVATSLAVASFAPWIVNAMRSKTGIGVTLLWGTTVYPLTFVLEKWAFNTAAVFFDAEFAQIRLAAVAALIIVVVLASVPVLIRFGDERLKAVALPLTAIPLIFFIGLDIARGSHYATIMRYEMAGWIGLELIVAGAIVAAMRAHEAAALCTFGFLVVVGAVSVFFDNAAVNWWDNNNDVAFQDVAKAINQPAIVLLCDDNNEIALVLARYLRPDTGLLLLRGDTVPTLPHGRRPIYLVVPTATLLTTLSQRDGKRYALVNVSPSTSTIIAGFHEKLGKSAPGYLDFYGAQITPDNGLWLLRPRS